MSYEIPEKESMLDKKGTHFFQATWLMCTLRIAGLESSYVWMVTLRPEVKTSCWALRGDTKAIEVVVRHVFLVGFPICLHVLQAKYGGSPVIHVVMSIRICFGKTLDILQHGDTELVELSELGFQLCNPRRAVLTPGVTAIHLVDVELGVPYLSWPVCGHL